MGVSRAHCSSLGSSDYGQWHTSWRHSATAGIEWQLLWSRSHWAWLRWFVVPSILRLWPPDNRCIQIQQDNATPPISHQWNFRQSVSNWRTIYKILMGRLWLGFQTLLSACKQPRHEYEGPLFLCFPTGAMIPQSHHFPSQNDHASMIDIPGKSTIKIE
jgi:hypothetical protein